MADYPALRAIFGVPVSRIDAGAIERAVADKVAESDQLDWKSAVYAKGAGAEIAKDVAALANHRGGIIILGVTEENSAAAAASPVTMTGAEVRKQVQMAVASNVSPFLGGVTVHQTDGATEGAGHYVVIEVAASRDAPHALSPSGPNGITLSYPVRNGAETRYLKEFEVAARYRDRVNSHADIVSALKTIHANGLQTVLQRAVAGEFGEASISVAAVPVNAGSRPVGVAARLAETDFLTQWDNPRRLPGHDIEFKPGHPNYVVRPAPQRTIFTTPETVIELGHHGEGFLCHALRFLPGATTVDDTGGTFRGTHGSAILVPAERIEWALFVAIKFLIDHAIDTGASGELELFAQLHFRHATTYNGGICIRIRGRRPHENFHELPVGSRLSPTTTPVQTTATVIGPDDMQAAAGAAAFFLATDMFAEFGIDEPHIFDDTGDSIPGHMGTQPGGVREWLTEYHDELTGTPGL